MLVLYITCSPMSLVYIDIVIEINRKITSYYVAIIILAWTSF